MVKHSFLRKSGSIFCAKCGQFSNHKNHDAVITICVDDSRTLSLMEKALFDSNLEFVTGRLQRASCRICGRTLAEHHVIKGKIICPHKVINRKIYRS